MSDVLTGNSANITTPLTATITAFTSGTGSVIKVATASPHLFGPNDLVYIKTGLITGFYTITIIDSTHFSLNGTTFTTTSTGTATDVSLTPQVQVPTDGDSFSLQLSGMLSSQQITLSRTQYLAALLSGLAQAESTGGVYPNFQTWGYNGTGQGGTRTGDPGFTGIIGTGGSGGSQVGVRGYGVGGGGGGSFVGGSSGPGLVSVGRGSNEGAELTGGSSSGFGAVIVGGGPNGVGALIQGTGTGVGVVGLGGNNDGVGGAFTANGGNADGMTGQGFANGRGGSGLGGSTGNTIGVSHGAGFYGEGGSGGGYGLYGKGTGICAGVYGKSDVINSNGGEFVGGSGGIGVIAYGNPAGGVGGKFTGANISSGLIVQSGTACTAAAIIATAGTGSGGGGVAGVADGDGNAVSGLAPGNGNAIVALVSGTGAGVSVNQGGSGPGIATNARINITAALATNSTNPGANNIWTDSIPKCAGTVVGGGSPSFTAGIGFNLLSVATFGSAPKSLRITMVRSMSSSAYIVVGNSSTGAGGGCFVNASPHNANQFDLELWTNAGQQDLGTVTVPISFMVLGTQ